MNINKKSSVSVVMITYGHENYIKQAINGVLMQECDFEVELIIANDCSPDTTDLVVKKIIEEHPNRNWIKYVKHKTNLGMMPNFIWALEQTKGKYIALCEGDDYWTDPLKLQKQVDFIESHPDYVLIHSDFFIKNSNGEYINSARNTISKIIRRAKNNDSNVVKYLVKGNYIKTLTVLIEKNALFKALENIAKNDNQIATIDYTLFLELSKLGKIHYQQEKTAVYRILNNSESNNINIDARLNFIETTINISRFYNQKFLVGINNLYFDRVLLSAQLFEFAKRGLVSKFISAFYKGIKSDKLNILKLKNYYYFIVLIVSKIK